MPNPGYGPYRDREGAGGLYRPWAERRAKAKAFGPGPDTPAKYLRPKRYDEGIYRRRGPTRV